MSNISEKKILIIIPTYNEVENIGLLIDEIYSLYPYNSLHILVVDDNSSDGTADLVRKKMMEDRRVHLLVRDGKYGLGTAYIEGFKYALSKDYEIITQMDADFSHNPKYLKDLWKTLEEGYDLVIGSRYINGVNVVNWPLSRLLLSYCASIYTRIVCGLPIKDPTGGFKSFKRKVLESIPLDDVGASGYSFQIEINYRVWKKGFKIKEIPIIFEDRKRGKSKMSSKIITEALYLIWKLRILSIFKKI